MTDDSTSTTIVAPGDWVWVPRHLAETIRGYMADKQKELGDLAPEVGEDIAAIDTALSAIRGRVDEPTLRTKIVAVIMGLIKPPALKKVVSIAELERILNSEPEGAVYLNTDGTVQESQTTTTTVGAVADAILALLLSATPTQAPDGVDERAPAAGVTLLDNPAPTQQSCVFMAAGGEERPIHYKDTFSDTIGSDASRRAQAGAGVLTAEERGRILVVRELLEHGNAPGLTLTAALLAIIRRLTAQGGSDV